jgi:hypothetical protein
MYGRNANLHKAIINIVKYLLYLFQGFMLDVYKIYKNKRTSYVFI